ncbi:MAG: bacterioferritin [Bacteriovoracaceae bacterium]|jgi:bacterioferritin|nr:bacterioferritin [Bacteriovoracaceae bacterium]
MKGNKEVIQVLNESLTRELTAINQYFLHARILEDWGLGKMGKLEYDASIDEMKHADELIKRILLLEGLPNVQRMGNVNIGQNVKEIMEADLTVERDAIPALKAGIILCEEKQDFVSRTLLTSILASEEDHCDWLETLLDLYDKVGEQNFLQSQM